MLRKDLLSTDKWRGSPGDSSHLHVQTTFAATKNTSKTEKMFNCGSSKMNIYIGLCYWPSNKRQKLTLSGSWSRHCEVLYVNVVVRRKKKSAHLGISAHFISVKKKKIIMLYNTEYVLYRLVGLLQGYFE